MQRVQKLADQLIVRPGPTEAAGSTAPYGTSVLYDIIIRDGLVFDGLRTPRFISDVGIRDGRVATIGRIAKTAPATRTIEGGGRLHVCPGFIDVRTHYDAQLFWDPYCTGAGWHGVTTVVIGQGGLGCAPCRKEDQTACLQALEKKGGPGADKQQAALPWDWESFPEYLDAVAKTPKGVNVHACLPLGPVKAYAKADRAEMRKIVASALQAGAAGISVPTTEDNTVDLPVEDLVELAGALSDANEGCIAADRGSQDLLEKLATASGRTILTTAGGLGEDQAYDSRWLIDCNQDTQKGMRIFASGITAGEYDGAPEAELKKVLAGQYNCPGGSGGGASTAQDSGWATSLISGCVPASTKAQPKAKGKAKAKSAKAKAKAAAKAEEGEGGAAAEPVLCSLEDAHWKASKYPALAAGIHDRGWVGEGVAADVLIYDPALLKVLPTEELQDLPGGASRKVRKAEGFKFIIVNGEVTFEDGTPSGKTPGKLLRSGRAA